MRPFRRAAVVLAAVVALTGLTGALPASACACGGAVPLPGSEVEVGGETALVHLGEGVETITMQLALDADAPEAALVVPTPTPARVTAGDAATFDDLERLSAPEEVVERRWWPSVTLMGGPADGAGAPGTSAPDVVDQVQLGPLEATTLVGGDVEGLSTWLRDNGYQLEERMVAALRPYVEDGWAFVAMRLVGDGPELVGDLDPVTMTFASERLVYPMRMSAQATGTQHVDLYVVADHRVERVDPDASSAAPDFAGWVDADEVTDADLGELVGERSFLTAFSWTLEPDSITSDFLFTPTDDVEVRRTVVVVEDVRVLGVMAGPFLLVAGVLAALVLLLVAAVLVAVRVGRRRVSATATATATGQLSRLPGAAAGPARGRP